MRKRLRKKLRLREFIEKGFEVWAQLGIDVPSPDAAKEAWDRYYDKTISFFDGLEALLHERGLCAAGTIGASASLLVSPDARLSANDEDREAVAAHLRSQPELLSFVITGLVDVDHGSPLTQALGSKVIKFEREPTVNHAGQVG